MTRYTRGKKVITHRIAIWLFFMSSARYQSVARRAEVGLPDHGASGEPMGERLLRTVFLRISAWPANGATGDMRAEQTSDKSRTE